MKDTLRIALVDKQRNFRDMVRFKLERGHRHIIVGEAGDGLSCQQLVERTRPDLVILDDSLAGESTIINIQGIHSASEHTRILVTIEKANRAHIVQLLTAGANGFLEKADVLESLDEAISSAMAS